MTSQLTNLVSTVAIRLAGEKFSKLCYDMFLFGFKSEIDERMLLVRDIGASTDAEQAFVQSYRHKYAEYLGVSAEEFNAMAQAFADDTGNPNALIAHFDELLIVALYAALFTKIEEYSGKFPIFRGNVSKYNFIKTINKTLAPYTTNDNHLAKLVDAFGKFRYLVNIGAPRRCSVLGFVLSHPSFSKYSIIHTSTNNNGVKTWLPLPASTQ